MSPRAVEPEAVFVFEDGSHVDVEREGELITMTAIRNNTVLSRVISVNGGLSFSPLVRFTQPPFGTFIPINEDQPVAIWNESLDIIVELPIAPTHAPAA